MVNERITGNDNMMSIITKLSERNPGAMTVLLNFAKNGAEIDPVSFMGGLSPMLSLDTMNIYGSSIWMLYKDVCHENIAHTLGILRAWQLGFVSESDLKFAIENYGKGIDVPALLKQVAERLPEFKMDWVPVRH